uniref:Uncharacterized protein n=1 Tax=Mesocestoides corti TaxID=53468 RepID=A0A5K3EZ21_MESCO
MKPEPKKPASSRALRARKLPTRKCVLSSSIRTDCARFLKDLIASEDIIQNIYQNISGDLGCDKVDSTKVNGDGCSKSQGISSKVKYS